RAMYVLGGNSVVGGDHLLVGRVNGANAAAYVKFDGLVDRLRNHTVYGAALVVVNYDSGSCRPRPLTVHPVTESWTPGTGHAYPGPSVGAALASKSFAHGYLALGQSQSACPAASEMIDLGAAGRNLLQRWANGEAHNGLSLRGSTSDGSAWKRLAGTGTANPPRLYVTHTPYNASYAIPKPTPEPPVLRNQDGRVKVTVTNKGAEAWAPGAYYLAYRAYNATTGVAVTQQRSANLTATVPRGGRATLDATIKALPPGAYFLDFTMVRTGGAVFTDHQVPPGRIVLRVFDVPPVVQEVYPPHGYQAQTLTPLLWARAVDTDAPPGATLQFKFEVCDTDAAGAAVNCTASAYSNRPSWSVPAGRLAWSKTYLWRAFVKDSASEVSSPRLALLAAVPQPEITSRIAGAPYASRERDFDAQVGNVSLSAVDATVATVGTELNLVRTYNSLDPRLKSAFGAGWSSRYDVQLAQDADGSGNVVVTYPDGQQVRFGRNPDGTYAAPAGRTAQLTSDSTGWKLLDTSGTTYQFALPGSPSLPNKLVRITDSAGRAVVLTYDTNNGKLAMVRVSNSQTNTAGRALRFAWTGDHITGVTTDSVNGAPLVWTYRYTGDLLTGVCAPDNACTTYVYAAGSHYRSAVADSRPESYWRLGDKEGTGAASEVAVNLGKDAGTYNTVTLGAPGALAGTDDSAAAFNGLSSYVQLPKGTVKKSRDAAVELWFRIGPSQVGGPLLGYQDRDFTAAAGTGVPVLYVGTDGVLRGQFATGAPAPLASPVRVNDDRWHHVVLSAMGTTQTMYLDGAKAAESTGTIDHSLLTFNQIGAASATPPASWPGWGGTAKKHFHGTIDEVAIYSHPLGPAAVRAHYDLRAEAPQQLTRLVMPSGKVAAEAVYDAATDRVKEYTDGNGGTWKIGTPTVYGNDTDLRRSVQVLDPADRPYLYEYDALAGRMLRSGTPLGLEAREEDRPGAPSPSPPPPTEVCSAPDPNDPAFCTTIPDSAGGPVFVRHTLDGMAIRSYFYNAKGQQNKVVNENGDTVELTFDDRGNVTSRKTCRTATQCFTSYMTYPAGPANLFDPRASLATETRDGRSAGATDNTYRTSYQYHFTGQLSRQTNPDGSVVEHLYTNGAEAGVGGGNPPAGLLFRTTTARGQARYAYYQNGDLAQVTQPSGLITRYSYDTLGRKTSETVVSDSFPAGVTTTYTYDAHSRPVSVTGPVTTDAVTGTRHQQQVVNEYDIDGNVVAITVYDLLGNDQPRVTATEYDEHNRPIRVTDAEGNETSYGYDRFG
ncbi:MAG TPA: LamG-like jellyroll fold domain-containing protein, partial [Micromonosporaceae bacterium]|nr:LamG-like jellyroll fold domain-containing protein [Micromonosporaceae bacterium]